jgi:hypothetical protein
MRGKVFMIMEVSPWARLPAGADRGDVSSACGWQDGAEVAALADIDAWSACLIASNQGAAA